MVGTRLFAFGRVSGSRFRIQRIIHLVQVGIVFCQGNGREGLAARDSLGGACGMCEKHTRCFMVGFWRQDSPLPQPHDILETT